MPNRLASSSSPYLRQHAENPVDWYPWGDEAFEKALKEDKPIFLSVGYSSCHWCHVMAHESFEDPTIGTLLNEHCISIKLDREERPDVDEAYMTAVQLSTGRGGWPMTVFMTPDKKPFFAGTYFPKEDRGQYPGFRSLVTQVGAGWKQARLEFEHTAHEFASALSQTLERESPDGELHPGLVGQALDALRADFDPERGGFGDAPKFPPHSALELCHACAEEHPAARGMLEVTLRNMVRGGIHDHVGGGFHRYSTDGEWRLPHFEKMLYDNALLLGVVDPATAQGIRDWLVREMRSPEGVFFSALDADSEGVEGKFYVWARPEIEGLLGDQADRFCLDFDIRTEGNFRDEATNVLTGENVLFGTGSDRGSLDILRAARDTRVRPGLDDKAIVGWNGLAIIGLAKAGFLDDAAAAAQTILLHDPLPRIVGADDMGFLEDFAAIALACHILHERSGDLKWKDSADRLTLEAVARFGDPYGGFYGTGDHHEILFGRGMPVFDSPIPSGNSLLLRALLRTDVKHPMLAKSFRRLAGWMERAPTACEGLILAYKEFLGAGGQTEEVRVYFDGEKVVFEVPAGMYLTDISIEDNPVADRTEGDLSVPISWRGEPTIRVRYSVCTDRECLPPVERRIDAIAP